MRTSLSLALGDDRHVGAGSVDVVERRREREARLRAGSTVVVDVARAFESVALAG